MTNLMNNRLLLRSLACLAFLVTVIIPSPAPAAAPAKDPGLWYAHALQFHVSAIDSPVRIDSRSTYAATDLDGHPELALGYSAIVHPDFELEMAISLLRASGTQYNSPGSGRAANRLDVDAELLFFWLTAHRRFDPLMDLFIPWIGGGINVGWVEQTDQEWIATAGGPYARPSDSHIHTAYGVHGCAGVDIYFARTSALALTIEGRYNIAFVSNSFDGDLDSAAFRMGLRWDIWPAD